MTLRTSLARRFARLLGMGTAIPAKKQPRLELLQLEERAVPAHPFTAAISNPTGADRPQLIAVGSFQTGPVKPPDLVITNATGFTLLFGDGHGKFGNAIQTTIPNTKNPEGI